jgi:hypothetical protein
MMTVRMGLALIPLLIIGGLAAAAPGPATPFLSASPAASPMACPVTRPNGNQPPPDANVFGREAGPFGNDALWTSLGIWGHGAVRVPADHVQPDGSLGPMKWAWYRYVPGKLTIEGRRLDAPAPPLRAWVPDGYGDIGFQATALTFPTGGCWKIIGRVGDARLTVVVLVLPPPTAATPATAD